MATKRKADAIPGKVSGLSIEGTVFSSSSVEEEKLPYHMPKAMKKKVAEIYELNPFLTEAQLDMVIRLVKFRDTNDELQKTIDEEGVTVTNRHGETVSHPALVQLGKYAPMILNLEKALAIATSARAQHVPKGQQNAPKKNPGGIPGLHIA